MELHAYPKGSVMVLSSISWLYWWHYLLIVGEQLKHIWECPELFIGKDVSGEWASLVLCRFQVSMVAIRMKYLNYFMVRSKALPTFHLFSTKVSPLLATSVGDTLHFLAKFESPPSSELSSRYFSVDEIFISTNAYILWQSNTILDDPTLHWQ